MSKIYEVLRRTKKKITGVDVDGKNLRFGISGGFHMTDGKMANEIKTAVGQDGTNEVLVIERDDMCNITPNYNKTHFTVPSLPWKDK